MMTFLVYIGMNWWSIWYPGAEPGGGGYVAQRIFSAKDEKNSLLATLWFNIAHYALRPWPWIIMALAVVDPLSELSLPERRRSRLHRVWVDYLPRSLARADARRFCRRLHVHHRHATELGRRRYLVNDFYRRFLVAAHSSDRHYVTASKCATVLADDPRRWSVLVMDTVAGGWELLVNIGAGTGAVYLLRWYWWRINAWSEISAMITGFAVSVALQSAWKLDTDKPIDFAWIMIITVSITTLVWLAVTFLTAPESKETLVAFYRRTHPSSTGWRPIAKLAPDVKPSTDGLSNLVDWVAGCALIYGILFGTGKLLLGSTITGLLFMGIAAFSGYAIYWDLSKRGWGWLRAGKNNPVAIRSCVTRGEK